jgi:methylated-DNA-[protein]-cysteine S-methyltransferase
MSASDLAGAKSVIEWAALDSPVGTLYLAASGKGLRSVCFEHHWEARRRRLSPGGGAEWLRADDPAGAASALARYFEGELDAPCGLEARPEGSAFQQDVWASLRQVPAGATVTYAQLATTSGHPRAARAVGGAMAANPLAVVVPCHRVVAAGGGPGGYGGGRQAKAWLLGHERRFA